MQQEDTITPADALLAEILEHPEDDFFRLAYADWLEENGEPERCEFIRVQIEASRLEAYVNDWSHSPGRAEEGGKAGAALATAQALREREKELLPLAGGWCEGVPAGFEVKNLAFRRGFIAEITCPLATWLEFGPQVVRCQPVEVVRVSDREPYHWTSGGENWYWISEEMTIHPSRPTTPRPYQTPRKLWQLYR